MCKRKAWHSSYRSDHLYELVDAPCVAAGTREKTILEIVDKNKKNFITHAMKNNGSGYV
jgi:hypothetical protein